MVFWADQSNGAIQIYSGPNLAAMATKFDAKKGYNSACVRSISEILASDSDLGVQQINDVKVHHG